MKSVWVVVAALLLIGCSEPPSSPRRLPTLVPSTAPTAPPAPGEQVILTLVDSSTSWCPVTFEPVPQLIVYDNGVALRAEHNGSHCEPVPVVWVGLLDVEAVRARLDTYFASPDSSVNLMANVPVDGMTSTISYRNRDGNTRSAQTPFRVGDPWPGAPRHVTEANDAFTWVWDELADAVPSRHRYQATDLVVGVAPPIGFQQPDSVDPPTVWPLTGTPWTDLAGHTCVPVSGVDAAAVLAGSDDFRSLQRWEVVGTPVVLSVELALPGVGAGCPD